MIIQKIAGELIQPGQAVYLGADERVYIYKNSDRGNIGKFLGFSLNRSSVINIVDILTEGEILDGFLIEGDIEFLIGDNYYIGSDGYPTRIRPSAPAFIHEIGVALNNNKLYIIDRFDKSALQTINVNTDSFEGDGTIGDPLDFADKADDLLYIIKNGEFITIGDDNGAFLRLPAGTNAKAALKLIIGDLLDSPATGAFEFTGDDLYFGIVTSLPGTSVYPPAYNDTYVKANSFSASYRPWLATDPSKSLIGAISANGWMHNVSGNIRFHIDLGGVKYIDNIYYENYHDSGVWTQRGVRNFTLWGSNDPADFADLVYDNDGNWVQLTTAQTSFDKHVSSNTIDPKYITITSPGYYRYYAFKFADNYGTTSTGLRRIELQESGNYRRALLMVEGDRLTDTYIPFATINGRLTEDADFTYVAGKLLVNRIKLAAGTATAGTAPLQFVSGVLLTTAEDGTIEYFSNVFYIRGLDSLNVANNVTTPQIRTPEIKTDITTPTDLTVTTGTAKTLKLVTSVWDDIQFPISTGKVPAANYPDFDTFTTNTKEYKFDVDDYIDLGANEMAHWWKEGTDIYFHIHTALNGDNASGSSYYAKFIIYIAYADTNSVYVETNKEIEIEIPNGTADLTQLKGTATALVMTGLTIGAQIKLRVKRIAVNPGTEYPNHIFVTQIGLHAEVDTMGSRQISTK